MKDGSMVDLGSGASGYLAIPNGSGPHPAVLVYMEAFGLNAYLRGECDRLARLGYVALSPDFYRGDVFPYGNFEPIARRIQAIGDAGFLADVRTSLAYLDAHEAARHDAYGVVGFCMGGRLAFLTAAEFGAKIAAAVSFYGGGIAPQTPRLGRAVLTERVPDVEAKLLLLYGADDESIAPGEIARVTEALASAKKDATVHVFPDAGHGFASIDRDGYVADVTEIAWSEAATFLARALPALS
ncbi:MAG: dienelactone hydrolase family protein [Candidatus Eremiobacteraeota bacterium]|nr:dienelactone hydrolase family protein [Candidatus Eremiobacteraeota bacterium]